MVWPGYTHARFTRGWKPLDGLHLVHTPGATDPNLLSGPRWIHPGGSLWLFKGLGKERSATIQDFPRARNGTGLAIVSFPNTDESEAKLYYQSMDGKLMSYDYKLKGTFKESWQNQDCGFFRPTFENGYKISTKRFPSNSKRRPWIYTRRGGPYCHSQ